MALDDVLRMLQGLQAKNTALEEIAAQPIRNEFLEPGQKNAFSGTTPAQRVALQAGADAIFKRDRRLPGMAGISSGLVAMDDKMRGIRTDDQARRIAGAKAGVDGLGNLIDRRLDIEQARPTPTDNRPNSLKEYEEAKARGYTGTYAEWKGINKPTTNINMPGNSKFNDELGKQIATRLTEGYDTAQEAAGSLRINSEARQLLDDGVITGTGATLFLNMGKALRQIGFDVAGSDIENTEAYLAQRATEVARIIKAFGAGTGLSDKDREYAEKAAAGQIQLDEKAIRKILSMHDRASRYAIKKHNDYTDRLPDSYFGGNNPERDFFRLSDPESDDGWSVEAVSD